MSTPHKAFFNSDRFFGTLIFIYVLAYVYFYSSNTMMANYFALFVYGLAFVKKVVWEKEKIHFDISIIFYLLFLLWGLLSFLWAEVEEAQIEFQPRMIFLFIVVLSFYNLLRWYNVLNYFLWGVIFAGLLNVLVFFNIIPFYADGVSGSRFAGTLINANIMGTFMSFSIFSSILLRHFFLKKKNKYLQWILYLNIPMSLYIIIQTGSRKGFLLGIVLLFLFFVPYLKSTKNIIYGSISVLVFIIGFNFLLQNEGFAEQFEFVLERFEGAQETIAGTDVEESTEYRIYLANQAFDIWTENPVLGIGLNNFQTFFDGYYSHNNFAEIAANLGAVGLILYYLFYLFCLLNVLKIKNKYLRISGVSFLVVFFIMEYAWVCYSHTIYIMMLLMVSSLAFLENKENLKEG